MEALKVNSSYNSNGGRKMIQFTHQEIEKFREKAKQDPRIIDWLLEQTKLVRNNELKIPDAGIANWGLYYYCSECSVELTFDFDKPTQHECPLCKKVHTGEPFDGAWWRSIHELNYTAAYYLGLLYVGTAESKYAEDSKNILLEYAKRYPGYEVHGDIPYNGPGKANAQTLCEAIFIRNFAYAYDLISDTLTQKEKEFICQDLLLCGAKFLSEHRQNQLHNHEVIINAAIGVVGLIDDNKELLDFAIYDDYGLIYQLEHGMLADGIWFECSLCYHFFALQNFYGFERFAVHTEHSQIMHPNYRKMVKAALKFLQPNYKFPMMNDTMDYHTELNEYNLYEFSYKIFREEIILRVMHKVYENEERNNIESFFYGVDTLPDASPIELNDYHDAKGSGTTIVRGEENQFLLFRHGKYGGEHDHYDRLSVSYMYKNQNIIPDLGTTGYGAFYHYEYFKNTGTHNTVMLNEENQAPCDGKVSVFEKTKDYTFVDAKAEWDSNYTMPDSFTICQWSEEAYQDVTMRRRILKTENYWIDIFNVESPKEKTVDWIMHFNGKQINRSTQETPIENFSNKKPFKYLKNVSSVEAVGLTKTSYKLENITTNVYSYVNGSQMIYAQGPGKPTNLYIPYMIQRAQAKEKMFINVITSHVNDDIIIKDVKIQIIKDEIVIKVKSDNKPQEHRFSVK